MISLALASLAVERITVDASSSKPISPFIYGVNFPDWKNLGVPAPLSRQGGNRMTAYNWETNASNAGSDWHHQNDGYLGESNEPGWTVSQHVLPALKNDAAALVTVPTAGYAAADKKADGDVNKTPNYLSARFLKSLPQKPGGRWAASPNVEDRVVYQDEFVAWTQKLRSSKTHRIWYSLDNEPDLWAHTHARIVPKPLGYSEFLANNIAFARGIRKAAPDALIFGPANYGWQGFRTFQDAPDAKGRDFIEFYLAGMKKAGEQSKQRLLDVLDIHFYPEAQGDGTRITTDKSTPGLDLARINAPRSLWDPNYVEKSWITENLGGKPIALIPRVQAQIAKVWPATKLAITEYDYGGGNAASGLVAQADVLGVYGRYGVFAACHWGINPEKKALIAAFRAFLAFDGAKARFGDRGLAVKGVDPAKLSVYAALDTRAKNRMTLVVISRSLAPQEVALNLQGFAPKRIKGYQAVHTSPLKPKSIPVKATGGTITLTAPPMSVVSLEAVR